MTRRRSRHQEERRRRFWAGAAKLVGFLAVIALTGYYAYQVGVELAAKQITALEEEAERARAAEKQAQVEAEQARGQLDGVKAEAANYRKLYEQVAPSKEVEDIMALVRAKLDAGLDARRVAFYVAAADKPRNCVDQPSKRFMVRTPDYRGAHTSVGFDNNITVSAEGPGAVNRSGGTEQWFDPAKPVTVRFSLIGGKESNATGVLPLQHQVIIKNFEYRFTVSPSSSRGFAEVTGDRCEIH